MLSMPRVSEIKIKKFVIGGLVILVAVSLYFKYKPTAIYLMGMMEASLARKGFIGGNGTFHLGNEVHRQEHSLSCEVASLKMALAAVGVDVPESELISLLPFDPTPKSGNVWGDPYKGFVGSIDGKMMSTGYGVYWDPIAKVGLHYRRTQALQHADLERVLAEVAKGNPVVVWGYYGNGHRHSWVTPEGRTINAVNGEHARVLMGYTGSSKAPEKLILLDPIYGELHWTVQEFITNWSALESGAVVVYKDPRWVKTENSSVVWEIGADGLTRYALAMDWNTFIDQGGVGEAITVVSDDWFNAKVYGGELKSL
jgi:uncharacterized protein YvpB